MEKLSQKARSLWAKKSKHSSLSWLPLVIHMRDSASIARKLWNHWLSEGAKNVISTSIREKERAEQLFVFLAAVHDLGKATPVFQFKISMHSELDELIKTRIQKVGLPTKPMSFFSRASKTPHALATQILLENAGCDNNISAIAGAHHGKPPGSTDLINSGMNIFPENFHLGKEGKDAWTGVQRELIEYALELAGFSSLSELPKPNMAAQVLLSGLVIMADWIVSREEDFDYIDHENIGLTNTNKRVDKAWALLELPYVWEASNLWMRSDLYLEHFGFTANQMQDIAVKTAKDIKKPGIFILEAPMGIGKTEAALVIAEIFAAKAKCKGVFFALPTQATSDAIFPRILNWVDNLDKTELRSIRLMHGKAQFNEAYQNLIDGINIDDEDGNVMVHEWFDGRKKAMLDDFAVGTIDQLLLAALKQKHVMLRHLGLSNKVVIIDECHAYDAYMSQYLNMALSWLGAYNVPVIVLSATLPIKKRRELIDAYMNTGAAMSVQSDPLGRSRQANIQNQEGEEVCEYPVISYSDGKKLGKAVIPTEGEARKIQLDYLSEEVVIEKLEYLLTEGGCAGIIVNTVGKAQKLADKLSKHFGEDTVRLLHSRFIAPDRAKKEKKLLEELGKPGANTKRPYKCIVVGTQVLEQSLDIDFDVLITDICPMDLLLQRLGRLHRHARKRPEKLITPMCLIIDLKDDDFESGTKSIYGKYLLMRTKQWLPEQIVLPDDISRLVQDVYNDNKHPLPELPEYQKIFNEHRKRLEDKKESADKFRIDPPWLNSNIAGWLDTGVSDKSGEATVRDADESIEIILIRTKRDKKIYFLPWIEGGCEILSDETPDFKTARALARCCVRLPSELCSQWNIDNTIRTLENLNKECLPEWQKSQLLSGELFLILDEKFSAVLCDYHLTYDQYLGLLYVKEDKSNAGQGV
jgi:CRISPR-associated endonuclease/helicase Cas3